ERWLAQRLAHRLGAADGAADGVCAGVAFPAPAAVVADVVAAATGVAPDDDPWQPERAVWPLLEVIDASLDEPWCAPLGAHLGEAGNGRRYAVARHLADLFASYATHRPGLLTAWRAGSGEPEGRAADLAWQAELWRRRRERIGVPSPAERLETACAALRADPGVVALPPRLSIFGPTRLPAEHLAVLDALAEHRDVHLWLPHPSPALWSAVVVPDEVPLRRTDPTADTPRHPLLGSLGRDARELQLRLPTRCVDVHHAVERRPPATLLERLQADLRDDRAPDGSFRLRPDDRSVQVHSCHGPDRQV